MLKKIKDADFSVQQIYVKPINVTIKHVTKDIHIIADMETPNNLRQDDCRITNKKTINKGQTNTVKKWK